MHQSRIVVLIARRRNDHSSNCSQRPSNWRCMRSNLVSVMVVLVGCCQALGMVEVRNLNQVGRMIRSILVLSDELLLAISYQICLHVVSDLRIWHSDHVWLAGYCVLLNAADSRLLHQPLSYLLLMCLILGNLMLLIVWDLDLLWVHFINLIFNS